MDEWIDILDGTGAKTGEVRLKSEAHRDGLWHRCFHCWVVHVPESGEPKLVLQRRAKTKDTWPGKLDVAVGGHLGAGEDITDGVREMREELGLVVVPEDLVRLGEQRVEREIPQGTDREFHGVFAFATGVPPQELQLQEEELDSVITLGFDDAESLALGREVPATEYVPGEAARGVTVGPGETIAGTGDYLSWAVSRLRELV